MEQRSEEWYEARRGKLTASRIFRLFAGPSTVASLMDVIQRENEAGSGGWLEGRDAESAGIAHGREQEGRGVSLYELLNDVETEKVGLIDHPTLRGVAASCDRIIIENGQRVATLEVKCPINPMIHLTTITYGMPQEHKPQVQTQMACTGLSRGVFVSFNNTFPGDKQIYHEELTADMKFQKTLAEKVQWFWDMFDKGSRPSCGIETIPQFF